MMGEKEALEGLRKQIDEIDAEILELLNSRGKIALEVSQLKKLNSFEVYDPAREREIEDKIRKTNPGPMPTVAVLAVFREIISGSRSLQQPMRVAFLGPEGSFSHQAAFNELGASSTLVPVDSLEKVFKEVGKGHMDYGIVPVENSTEGSVGTVLDMFLETDLSVLAEVYQRISHCVMTKSGTMTNIKTIASHPQALGQCRGWVEKNLPDCKLLETPSTARAAVLATEDGSVAAIAGEIAAKIYKLDIVENMIEDSPENSTRFWVIGRGANPPPTGRDKTSVVFSLKHEPGSLNNVLSSLGKAGINLTKIESRPTRERPWEYVFFVDFVGHCEDPAIDKVLGGVEKNCIFLKVLGSYPMGSAK